MPWRVNRPEIRTTAADVSRNFGTWQDRAMQAPVLVTHHGRPRVVILSFAHYQGLLGAEQAAVAEAEPARRPNSDFDQIAPHLMEGVMLFDADLRLTYANVAAMAALGPSADRVVGKSLDELNSEDRLAVQIARLRQVMRAGEPAQFDVQGILNPHRRYTARAFPFRRGVALVFSQTTELVELRHDRERSTSLMEAIDDLSVICHLQTNTMGLVVEANAEFQRLVGFSTPQLDHVRLVDLVTPAMRHDLTRDLSLVIEGRRDGFVGEVELLSRRQQHVAMHLAATRLLQDGVCIGLTIAGLATSQGGAASSG